MAVIVLLYYYLLLCLIYRWHFITGVYAQENIHSICPYLWFRLSLGVLGHVFCRKGNHCTSHHSLPIRGLDSAVSVLALDWEIHMGLAQAPDFLAGSKIFFPFHKAACALKTFPVAHTLKCSPQNGISKSGLRLLAFHLWDVVSGKPSQGCCDLKRHSSSLVCTWWCLSCAGCCPPWFLDISSFSLLLINLMK
jgi:hypothetical protein